MGTAGHDGRVAIVTGAGNGIGGATAHRLAGEGATVIGCDINEDGEPRIRVIGDRVDCPRIGLVDLDRCRECAYLVRLEAADPDRPGQASIVCSLAAGRPEFDW